jgi:hypothetical protein
MSSSRSILVSLLVAGGLLLKGASVSSAQSTGSWTTGAPMPSERGEAAAAATGGKIYIVGAFTGDTPLPRAATANRGHLNSFARL